MRPRNQLRPQLVTTSSRMLIAPAQWLLVPSTWTESPLHTDSLPGSLCLRKHGLFLIGSFAPKFYLLLFKL